MMKQKHGLPKRKLDPNLKKMSL